MVKSAVVLSEIKENLKEKEDINMSYQKKLEILQNKMIDNTDENNTDSNSLTNILICFS